MLIIFLVMMLAVIIAVSIHYLILIVATRMLDQFHGRHPASIILTLLLAVFAHILEILLFAVAWQLLYQLELIEFSIANPNFYDLIYFSGSTFTTVGYGDITLIHEGRIAAVVEGVLGLVLITWTASFSYLEMNRKWIHHEE